MYRCCIFCSADLGTNEAVEAFPVGRRLAFDARKARLWAVCPKCARWNLAPIEERWEAVETAEKQFRDARLRVQSENIGLCKLPDGTQLVRVGEALPGELAAWRYGTQLASRRRQYLLLTGAVVVGGGIVVGGLYAAGVIGAAGSAMLNTWNMIRQMRRGKKTLGWVPPEQCGATKPLLVRRWQLNGARIILDEAGLPALHLPHGLPTSRYGYDTEPAPLTLHGDLARTLTSRAMVFANASGADREDLTRALRRLIDLGGPEPFIRHAAERGSTLGLPNVAYPRGNVDLGDSRTWPTKWERHREGPNKLTRAEALALEMALHEEQERRAMDGELSALEAAWREAEEIAAIADVLPDDPLDRLAVPRQA